MWVAALLCGAACRGPSGDIPRDVEGMGVAQALDAFARTTMVPGNSLELVENSDVFTRMVEDIKRAQVSVNIVSYIWRGEHGPSELVGQALIERAPGVACRILIDPFGSLKFSSSLEQRLKQSGCDIRRYGAPDVLKSGILVRNHRKIQIVDGKIGITGGFGIWTSWEGQGRAREQWRDTAVRAEGPVVAQMQRAFEQNWVEMEGEPLPARDYPKLGRAGLSRAAFVASSPRAGTPSPAEMMTHILVGAAKESLWIANSYFIPDGKLIARMVARRAAGVDVRVLAPGMIHDVPPVRAGQRHTYKDLLRGGVRIWEYEVSMMHAKTMVVDNRFVAIGSTNFDQLSFDVLEEGSLVADAPRLARKLKQHIEEDLDYSKEITREIWDNRDLLPDIARTAVGLFSDWL